MTNPKSQGTTLTATQVKVSKEPRVDTRFQQLSWIAVAVSGSVGTLLLGWLVVAVLVGVGWLEQTHVSFAQAISSTGQLWLLVHGVTIEPGSLTISMVPLGITGLIGLALAVATSYSAGYMGEEAQGSWRSLTRLTIAAATPYLFGAFLLSTLIGQPAQAMALLLWTIPLAGVSAAAGAAHGLRLGVPSGLPEWTTPAVRSAGITFAAALAAATIALASSLVVSWDRVVTLQSVLDDRPLGHGLMVAAQLAYLPNALAWAGSYIFGTGFSVGTNTWFAPAGVTSGVIPGIPILGAIPENAGGAHWVWLALPISACLLGGWWLARNRNLGPRVSVEAGLASGFFAGTLWVLFEWVSRGDLGTNRLVGLGPVFPAALIVIPVAAVLVATASWGTNMIQQRRPSQDGEPVHAPEPGPELSASDADPEESTIPLAPQHPEGDISR